MPYTAELPKVSSGVNFGQFSDKLGMPPVISIIGDGEVFLGGLSPAAAHKIITGDKSTPCATALRCSSQTSPVAAYSRLSLLCFVLIPLSNTFFPFILLITVSVS